MGSEDEMETVTLECHKTGREYEAEVTVEDGEMIVDAACPYCENRGHEAIVDDLQMRIDDVEKRTPSEKRG